LTWGCVGCVGFCQVGFGLGRLWTLDFTKLTLGWVGWFGFGVDWFWTGLALDWLAWLFAGLAQFRPGWIWAALAGLALPGWLSAGLALIFTALAFHCIGFLVGCFLLWPRLALGFGFLPS